MMMITLNKNNTLDDLLVAFDDLMTRGGAGVRSGQVTYR